jgi:hypothetical protein
MAKVTKITASVGTSAEIRGIWYKFNFGMEVELGPKDDLDEVKQRAWNTCLDEVESQIEEVARG